VDKKTLIKQLVEKYRNEPYKWMLVGRDMGMTNEGARSFYRVHYGSPPRADSILNTGNQPAKEPEKQIEPEEIVEQVLSLISESAKLFKGKVFDPQWKFKGTPEDAVLEINNMHDGMDNKWFNLETGKTITTYNYEIQGRELQKLLTSMLQITQGKNITCLNLRLIGDMLTNDRIFPGQQFSIEEDVGSQLWHCIGVLAAFIQQLLLYYPKVSIIGIPGNHGRTLQQRTAELPTSSYEYHLIRTLQVIFNKEPRVTVIAPPSYDYLDTIRGHRYYMTHGNDVIGWAGFPYYGIIRKFKSRHQEVPFDIALTGHFHLGEQIPISGKVRVFIGGCWIENEAYAWSKYGCLSHPEQWFFGVSDKYPTTWNYSISLTPD
jgi:hypothetical protein